MATLFLWFAHCAQFAIRRAKRRARNMRRLVHFRLPVCTPCKSTFYAIGLLGLKSVGCVCRYTHCASTAEPAMTIPARVQKSPKKLKTITFCDVGPRRQRRRERRRRRRRHADTARALCSGDNKVAWRLHVSCVCAGCSGCLMFSVQMLRIHYARCGCE